MLSLYLECVVPFNGLAKRLPRERRLFDSDDYHLIKQLIYYNYELMIYRRVGCEIISLARQMYTGKYLFVV